MDAFRAATAASGGVGVPSINVVRYVPWERPQARARVVSRAATPRRNRTGQLDRLICSRIRLTTSLNLRIEWRSLERRGDSEARCIRHGEVPRLRVRLEHGSQAAKVDGHSLARCPGHDKHR